MPELPEIEALRRELDEPVAHAPVGRAGPMHIATLKTFDPPLTALEGRSLAGARRRGKHLLFPTDDGALVLHVHLMSAGRLSWSAPGGKRPKSPAFQLNFADGSALVLTEAGKKKRAKVGLYTPEAIEAELAHLGPGCARARAGAARRDPARQLRPAPRAAPRPARRRRDRPRLGERDPPPGEALAVRAHEGSLGRGDRAPLGDDRRDALRRASSYASRESATRRRTASTATSASRAGSAGPRSPRSTSRSTRSSTARRARPAGGC